METKEAILALFENDPLKTLAGQQIANSLAPEHSRGAVSRNLGILVDDGRLERDGLNAAGRAVTFYRLPQAGQKPVPEPASGQQCDSLREKIESEIAKREAEIALLRDLL